MELQLVSASSASREPTGCTLIYRLDDENSDFSLPVVHESHPWAGKTVSALRDRFASCYSIHTSLMYIAGHPYKYMYKYG